MPCGAMVRSILHVGGGVKLRVSVWASCPGIGSVGAPEDHSRDARRVDHVLPGELALMVWFGVPAQNVFWVLLLPEKLATTRAAPHGACMLILAVTIVVGLVAADVLDLMKVNTRRMLP